MSEDHEKYAFARVSDGMTHKARMPEQLSESCNTRKPVSMYITINDHGSIKPFEMFARFDVPEHHELVTVITRMASMALREGVPAEVVAKELQDISSPTTRHIIPGTSETCPSITARIGQVLGRHIEQQQRGEAA